MMSFKVKMTYEVYMLKYDVQVKLWSQLCFQDYDYDIYERYNMWKAISHIMMMDPLWSKMFKKSYSYVILVMIKVMMKYVYWTKYAPKLL